MSNELNEEFVLLSLGTNLADRKALLESALAMLSAYKVLSNIRVSNVYETEPYGYLDQPWFLNLTVCGTTLLKPFELFDKCKDIEKKIGRIERLRWHEREIDIDIIFYGKHIIENELLTIPHKRMQERNFVLIPANDLVPNYIHPKLNKTINQLLAESNDNSIVKLFSEVI